jgi:hypothetical protein
MSNLIRTAKPGSKWNSNDLTAYNISVILKGEREFFGTPIDQGVDISDYPEGILSQEPDYNYPESFILLKYLDLAMRIRQSEESAVDDFASRLLETLGYTDMNHLVCTRKSIRFLICGTNSYAKTDICIMDDNEILFILQEDKSHISPADPEPQIIAEAIAAFQYNNNIRVRQMGLEAIREYIFPCITMIGTYPTFYKIRVTKELDDAVRFGYYPNSQTQVHRFEPIIGGKRYDLGMKDIENRIRILKCFKIFRKIVPY